MTCPVCGGVCKGNDVRCADAYRLQSRADEAAHRHALEVEQRRAELHLVEAREPVVLARVTFDDNTYCYLNAEQYCRLDMCGVADVRLENVTAR